MTTDTPAPPHTGATGEEAMTEIESLRDRIRELEAEIYDLRATLNRLPPYDADGFYIDHGEHGPEPVSVADVMDSLYGTILALDAARAKEQK